MSDKPTFVSRDMMTADEGYVQWMADIKQRFRQSQIKAAVRVNTAMLEFYWSVGRDLVALRAEERWGAGVVKQFALDMRQAFPDETGFSYSNVKYMKQWYSFYYERVTKSQRPVDQISHQAGGQFEDVEDDVEKSHYLGGQIENPKIGQQVADQLDENEKGHQVADQLEKLSVFGIIAIKRVFLRPKTKQNGHKKKQTSLLSQISPLHLCTCIVDALYPISIVCPAKARFANRDFKLSSI